MDKDNVLAQLSHRNTRTSCDVCRRGRRAGGQEFVVGGYFPVARRIRLDHRWATEGKNLMYVASPPERFCSGFAARSALAVEVTGNAGLPNRESRVEADGQ